MKIEELKEILNNPEMRSTFLERYDIAELVAEITALEVRAAQTEEISEESKLPVFQITKDEYGLHASSIPADESLEARTEAAMHCAMMIREASK